MLISEFIRHLERVIPLDAVGYERDAVGLQVGPPAGTEITNALFAYEVTREVVAEAQERGANIIVAFHPLIFPTIGSVTPETRTGGLLRELIRSDIALYIQHTAFDTHPEFGTSQQMAHALGLTATSVLTLLPKQPHPAINSGAFGMGVIGELPEAVTAAEMLRLAAGCFGAPLLRHNAHGPEVVQRVAVLGGSGMEYYASARSSGADAFITADVRYHDFYRADHDRILLIDAGHAETERFVTKAMVRAATMALSMADPSGGLPSDALMLARTEPNSVRYYR